MFEKTTWRQTKNTSTLKLFVIIT